MGKQKRNRREQRIAAIDEAAHSSREANSRLKAASSLRDSELFVADARGAKRKRTETASKSSAKTFVWNRRPIVPPSRKAVDAVKAQVKKLQKSGPPPSSSAPKLVVPEQSGSGSGQLRDLWAEEAPAVVPAVVAVPLPPPPAKRRNHQKWASTGAAVAAAGYSVNPSLEAHQAELTSEVSLENIKIAAEAKRARNIGPSGSYGAADLDADSDDEAGGGAVVGASQTSGKPRAARARATAAAAATERLPLTLPLSSELTGSLRSMPKVGAAVVAAERLSRLVAAGTVAAKTLTGRQKAKKRGNPYRNVLFPRAAHEMAATREDEDLDGR